MKRTIIDPPSGWMYGFPKSLPPEYGPTFDLRQWFLANGYPEKDVALALRHSRYWEVDEPDVDDVVERSNN